jgi:radical SAM superfamily enzyme YgiQ (UPF0313 family)
MKKKKLLIIKPPYTAFPVGFAYVLACLDKYKIPFDFVDTTLPFLDYRMYLRKNDYLAVASGGLVGHFRFFNEIVKNVRKVDPQLPVILGGNIVKDIKYELLFNNIGVNFGIVGEAETSLPHLIKILSDNNDDFSNIPGIIYKDKTSSKIIRNTPQRLNLDEENVLPAWQYFDLDYYSPDQRIPFLGNRSCMPILSGRGCVGQCSFCSPTIGSFSMRPIKHVMEEIELLNNRYKFDWLIIYNEMFCQTKEQILAFCQHYNKLKIKKPWVCSLRTDVNFDKETFRVMKEAGCVNISIGIESGSNKILEVMRKNTTAEQTKTFHRISRDAGLSCNGTFMVGNETETQQQIRESIDMVTNEGMNADASLTAAYPGTLIYKNALKRGLIRDEWDYLQKFKFASNVWDWGWINRSYVNISGIPDEDFWDTIVTELRRYYTHLFNRHQAKNMEFTVLLKTLLLKAQGACPVCGENILSYPPFILLEMETYCSKCCNRVYFNIYEHKNFRGHFDSLSKEIRKAQKIVICGTNSEASAFLRIDRFNLDYSKIKGFLQVDFQPVWSDIFISKPRITLEDLITIKPDVIFIVGEATSYSKLLIKHFYFKNGLPDPVILGLLPESKKYNLIVRALSKMKYPVLFGGLVLTKSLYLVKKLAFKSLVLLINICRAKSKRIVAKKVFHKLKYFYLKLIHF